MQYLLDTHTLLWFIEGNNKLPQTVRDTIENTQNECFVSLASFWEIAIKMSLNKLHLTTSLDNYYEKLAENGIVILPILRSHISKVIELPFHHRDPFDRILIAQAIVENLTILSKDPFFEEYTEINIIW